VSGSDCISFCFVNLSFRNIYVFVIIHRPHSQDLSSDCQLLVMNIVTTYLLLRYRYWTSHLNMGQYVPPKRLHSPTSQRR
jgi:hypothetical protein